MASCISSPHHASLLKPSLRCKNSVQASQVKAHAFRDEGRQSNIVDGNMSVLKERVAQVKMKERLERCCRCENGWNYAPASDNYKAKKKQDKVLSEIFELLCLVGGTIGFTCLSGTLLLCLVSLFFRLNLIN